MELLERAFALKDTLIHWRRSLHACPEVGFDLPRTRALIRGELERMGLTPKEIGRGSITAELGPEGAELLLLRGDVDGLSVPEEADLPFRAENGRMHACGHDLHGTMLLGAAALLKEGEHTLSRRVRFLFQGAEETLLGAADAVSAGVCEGVSSAYMLHVTVNTGLEVGTVILPPAGVVAPGADYFEISVTGKGCHGADPASGIDPLSVAARILLGLQHLPAREFPSGARAALTVGALQGGEAFNVIPDTAFLRGSLRCYDEDLRSGLKERVKTVATATAAAFRTEAAVHFPAGCPSLRNDETRRNALLSPLRKTLGEKGVLVVDAPSGTAGSEDFAVIARAVPSVMLAIAAGDPGVALHHPKVVFDEAVLPYGAAALAAIAVE